MMDLVRLWQIQSPLLVQVASDVKVKQHLSD
jgi:hypothetical protein